MEQTTTARRRGDEFRSIIENYQRRLSDTSWLAHGQSHEHLEEYGAILRYLSKRGSGHYHYRHYATRDRIRQIVDGSAVYLTDGSSWNDCFDRERFNPSYSGFKRFGLCLSASTVESIAMWMLYGGRGGDGAMIDFDRGTMREAMRATSYEFGHFEGGKFVCTNVVSDADLDLSIVDVLYFAHVDGGFEVERAVGEDPKVFLSEAALNGIEEIAKHASWSYEKEVRLVARVGKLVLGAKCSQVTCMRLPAGARHPRDGGRLRRDRGDEHTEEQRGPQAQGRPRGRAVAARGGNGAEQQVQGGARAGRGVGGGPRPLPRLLRRGAGDQEAEDAVLGHAPAPRRGVERAHGQRDPARHVEQGLREVGSVDQAPRGRREPGPQVLPESDSTSASRAASPTYPSTRRTSSVGEWQRGRWCRVLVEV